MCSAGVGTGPLPRDSGRILPPAGVERPGDRPGAPATGGSAVIWRQGPTRRTIVSDVTARMSSRPVACPCRRMRICQGCGRRFQQSSRHLRCPACRSRDRCGCGRPKQVKSATCSACRRSDGGSNGNWKGGRTKHKAGYALVRVPDHPNRNGVRDDNRPENLELWVRPQPSGIRAVDAVAWARMILQRYEGALPPPTTLRAKR
jgi:hypothetical protein